MAYRLPPLNALRAFEAAARHLSFKLAAEELAVTPTAISHQIRGLEEYLGCALFRRLTRALELTPQGEALLPKVREGLECFAGAVAQVRALGPLTRLVVVAPPSFASRWLVPRLQGFGQREPQIELHLSASARMIDGGEAPGSPSMVIRPPRGEGPEAWIRYGTGRYPGFRVERLFMPEYTAVCSPVLLRAKRPLRKPGDLRYHLLIHDDTIPLERERPSWADWLRAAGVSGVDASAGPHFTDSGLAIAAAADGLGVALLSRPLVAGEIAAGRLVAPFDVTINRNYAYFLITRPDSAGQPAIEAFRAWLVQEAAGAMASAASPAVIAGPATGP
ncbi:transcriptional regulator GcvA [Pseudothauera rhizosphaerae]|uniref:Transcriptional regulator GcvA n=1 Tax=Pseudothauera rhizosphaerae TaxID=2565932 RepID=A0A4S4ACN9_9RHOO|nr:transcriptional regulator GcvA [Pseudothauera rhizosphaerae]THF56838.1 transcriptional regulator GcvA [Pseudothauera rhizosphaerae]